MDQWSKRSAEEQAQTERLETYYVRAQSTALREIERRTCGCDYGGCSWTTRDEADRIATRLELEPGRRFLDIGAGSGWPGLYMAEISGSDVALVDLPLAGLQIAAARAVEDNLPGDCWVAVADGAKLPFAESSFDAISHSDVLCCLVEKRAVLESCRGVIDRNGMMVFSVISITPGLSGAAYQRAVECGPEFIASDTDYPGMLDETGWTILEVQDVTVEFAESCGRLREAEAENADALQTLLGPTAYAERKAGWERRHSGASEGLLKREIFYTTPGPE